MNRRGLFQRLLALGAASTLTSTKADAHPLDSTVRVLRVRPQDLREWQMRTQCSARLVSTPSGVEAVANTGSLRIDLLENKLYFLTGDPDLPKIDRIEPCARLLNKPPYSWETEVVPSN